MSDPRASVQPLSEWLEVSRTLEIAVEGLTEDDLDVRGGPDGWSIRETVHHVVESNLVACTIAIAAAGTGGCTFDCSWLNPDRAWMERMGYRGAVAPAVHSADAGFRRPAGPGVAAPPEPQGQERQGEPAEPAAEGFAGPREPPLEGAGRAVEPPRGFLGRLFGR